MPDIEAIYPLAPSQQGMLFETLSGTRPGIHVEQSLFALCPDLDVARFERAWQAVADRHMVLRTAFLWRGRSEPLQVALRHAQVPLSVHDWRDLSPRVQDERLAEYLQNDRRKGFAPERAPLLRLALFRTNDHVHKLVFTFHHILMDGWSLSLILAEVLAHYEAIPVPCPATYQTFIRWQRAQDPAAAEAYWRATLAGFTHPTAWGVDDPDTELEADGYDEIAAQIPPEVAKGLRALAEAHRVTLGTLFQGVWGLLLARYSGQRDVLFGTTVSGRPPELPGVLSMIGLFINTVPMRLQLPSDERLWPWLTALQLRSAVGRSFEQSASGQIHRWSELPTTRPLYETVLAYENYPEDQTGLAHASLHVDLDTSRTLGAQTSYPVTLLVGSRAGFSLKLVTRRDRIAKREAAAILAHVQELLARLVAGPERPIDELIAAIPPTAFPRIRPAPVHSGAESGQGPRDAVELQLATIWREVFGCARVSVHDNFFQLGGHSLLALDLVGRIEKQFGVSLPLAALLDRPTIERVANTIRSAADHGDPTRWMPVIFLGGSSAPRSPVPVALFCVPGAAMDTISLQPLASALGDDLPVYGLQPRGLDGLLEPSRSVEETAASNVAAIRAVQPVGPYYIAGHSYGAHVAYEMTQQLRDAGCEVALLAVLDERARTSGAGGPPARDDEARLRRLLSLLQRFFGRDLPFSADALRSVSPEDRITHIAAVLAEADLLPVELGPHRLKQYVRVGEATAAAFEQYTASGRHPVRTLVVRARQTHDDDQLGAGDAGDLDETLGWRVLGGGEVSTDWVDGDHVTMMTHPHVDAVAELLRRTLGRGAAAA